MKSTPNKEQAKPVTTARLSQVVNAERWLSHEIARLKAEGHEVIGDCVIIKRNQGNGKAIS